MRRTLTFHALPLILTFVGGLLVTGCGGSDDALTSFDQEATIDADSAGLYAASTYIWDSRTISVCWENPSAAGDVEREWVRSAVEGTWGLVTPLDFTGWGACLGNPGIIRILIEDTSDGSFTYGLGWLNEALYGAMVLNLSFQHWMQDCQDTRERCIRAMAVHEFGHALGFANEEARISSSSCRGRGADDADTVFGEDVDFDSVMYECGDSRWRRGGRLSQYDIKGAALLYGDSMWGRQFGAEQSAGGWEVGHHERVMGDVTGDGLPDIVGFGYSGVFVSRTVYVPPSLDAGYFAPSLLHLQAFGYAQNWRVDRHPRTVADVNGDGKADLIGFHDAGVHVALSNGLGFGAPQFWVGNFGYNAGQWRVESHVRTVADVNGDGKADVVGFGDAGVYVSLSTGSSFGASRLWLGDFGVNQQWFVPNSVRAVADVNGDGRADIVGFSKSGVYVALANNTGTGFNPTQQWTSEFTWDQGWRVDRHVRTVADVDGDGRADIVGFGESETRAALSTGSSFSASTLMSPDFVYGVGDWRVNRHPRFAVDINNDGRADLIGFGDLGEYVKLR
ncbi:FG-GAP-like repeat-containing protein [Myxococcus xanthus]|uniref:FG-GAP-like repeat-containing protein n=1 Tax=Myxococcus xanthus TaxID=34 RepID=UPI001126F283|nr:FG-GAP-like repeat-containing protein [Myxococcus xanthus]QDF06483.1 hypothetical protein BHS04_25275 [Myxococcus xanthus]